MTEVRPLEHYEDRYDDITINVCRRGERLVNRTFRELEQKMPAAELEQRKIGWYLQYSLLYFSAVESVAAKRYRERHATVAQWMAEDEAKEARLAEAHIQGGTYCRKCGKDMEVITKTYMHRAGQKEDDILIMFECSGCHKRYAFWEDGTQWEGAQIHCEKCGGIMTSTHTTKGEVITTTTTCTKCGHIETDVMDFSDDHTTPEPDDPYYELDRKRFLFDSHMMSKFEQKAQHLQHIQELQAAVQDREEHHDIYEAIRDIKQLKIAQLSELLAPALAKKKYTEFKFSDPEIGEQVWLKFSCLDADEKREASQSKKDLQQLLDQLLNDTNWQLAGNSLIHRMGYLTGQLRAYESEEDLRKLVEKRMKTGKPKPTGKTSDVTIPTSMPTNIGLREAAQVYMHNLTLDSKPAEITLKSGKKKPTHIPYIRAELNPLLRVIIPMRDNDENVPDFVRTFDFKMGGQDIPKVSKDSLGREIKRT